MNATSALTRAATLVAAALIFTGSHALGQSVILSDPGTGIETQTLSFTNQGPGSPVYDFNLFNSAEGTLNSVTIELVNITSTGSATVYNTSASAPPFGTGNGVGYSETLTGGFSNTYAATSSTSASDVATTVITSSTVTGTNIAATGSVTSINTGILSANQSPNPVTTVVSDKGNYIGTGTGTITITLASTTGANVSGNAGSNTFYALGSAAATASGSLILIYNYTPVPEPRTTAAAMIGLALCLLVGRKFFKGRSLRVA
jgi:hypothetical protein